MRIAWAHGERLTRRALTLGLAECGHSPVWQAANASEAGALLEQDPPRVFLVDAELLDPRAALVSHALARGCAALVLAKDPGDRGVYAALAAGALQCMRPPRLQPDGSVSGVRAWLEQIRKLEPLIAQPCATLGTEPGGRPAPLVAIGASTGGPGALARLLESLPRQWTAALIIVQHIDDGFSSGLAEWLAVRSGLRVSLAESGTPIARGQVYVAPPGAHLGVSADQRFVRIPARAADLHVPGIDVLFESLLTQPRPGLAALLTGMGRDGARGLLALREAGWHTIAQSEASCAVFGMPKAAIGIAAAAEVLDLPDVASRIARWGLGDARP